MTLYEIDKQLMEAVGAAFDEETGEILDEEAYAKLDALQEERDHKIENVALWIKNLRAEAEAYKVEKESFARKQQVADNKAKSLTKFLEFALNGEKFKTSKVTVSYRRSESVEVEKGFDITMMDDRFLRFKEPELIKVAVKEYLKAGAEINGVALVEKNTIQIK